MWFCKKFWLLFFVIALPINTPDRVHVKSFMAYHNGPAHLLHLRSPPLFQQAEIEWVVMPCRPDKYVCAASRIRTVLPSKHECKSVAIDASRVAVAGTSSLKRMGGVTAVVLRVAPLEDHVVREVPSWTPFRELGPCIHPSAEDIPNHDVAP